ncbi:hypothetical protein [Hyphomicrobium sp. LHD-15]|uniref:hypothetical protein n=1 Tax=Hyphomicrobium sp. LHD-15 TaxID=3072142 RepID=UPI00280EDCC0|nr:hypothetical protein [Hyphomicrobium sp. LHD-15]MDQ8698782.1 hypothetical protein [Hyphomicrobium sp. LHD-15]
MKKLALFKIMAVAAALALPATPSTVLAQQSGAKEKALRGVVRPAPKRGGYSYKYLQGTNTRKFTDPTYTEQTRAGPFDSGFFFSSPNAPHGGDSPYMQ